MNWQTQVSYNYAKFEWPCLNSLQVCNPLWLTGLKAPTNQTTKPPSKRQCSCQIKTNVSYLPWMSVCKSDTVLYSLYSWYNYPQYKVDMIINHIKFKPYQTRAPFSVQTVWHAVTMKYGQGHQKWCNRWSSMNSTIMQSWTLIMFMVSQKIATLKFLTHTFNQSKIC